ncbi:MAG: zinc ribbon domain-containing protein [Succinivibrio sp.]|nr:zinc ribbon domain-containing protein [Succinivibrio sp.]
MPFYDYRCKNCELKFTVRQSMSGQPEAKCPKCGSNLVYKVMAPALVSIRGKRCACSSSGDAESSCCAHCPHLN